MKEKKVHLKEGWDTSNNEGEEREAGGKNEGLEGA